jgi:hypothetical protein
MDTVVARPTPIADALAACPSMPCGVTHPDPEIEERTQALRLAEGYATEGGCGKPLRWVLAYRCVECGRWYHRDCILQHFAETGDDRARFLPSDSGQEA